MLFSQAQPLINEDHVKRIEIYDETLEIHFIHLDNSVSKWKFNPPDAQDRFTRTWQIFANKFDLESIQKKHYSLAFKEESQKKRTEALLNELIITATNFLIDESIKEKKNWFKRIFRIRS